MTAFYYAKGGTTVSAVHHTLTEITDRSEYGTGTYVICDLSSAPFPVWDDTLPGYDYPTVTNQMQADSSKNECEYRIFQKISANAQRNINAYIAQLSAAAANGAPMSPAQIADCNSAAAINAWIGVGGAARTGMLAACDTLIAAVDMQWYLDGKWPAWNSAWDTFVARF